MKWKLNSKLEKIGNLSFDIAIWLVGIVIGLVPALIMSLFYPDNEIIAMSPIDRIFSDVEVVYAFLSGVALLIIEQLNVDDINAKARSLLKKGKKAFFGIDIIFMMLYIAMKPFSIEKIEGLLNVNIITFNKFVVVLSLFMTVSLLITHSLQNPNSYSKEVEPNVTVCNNM